MQIGVDSFAATESFDKSNSKKNAKSVEKLINRIIKADRSWSRCFWHWGTS